MLPATKDVTVHCGHVEAAWISETTLFANMEHYSGVPFFMHSLELIEEWLLKEHKAGDSDNIIRLIIEIHRIACKRRYLVVLTAK